MGLNLFDGSGDSDNDDVSKIEINKEYARRYEHNKKREDLQRLEELKKKGLVDDDSSPSGSDGSDSDDSEPDDVLISSGKQDLEFFDALLKVKKQDPILKEKDAKLFPDASTESEEEEEEQGQIKSERKKGRAMYLKDVVAKQLVEEGPEFEEKSEFVSGAKSYDEEQEEIRKAFLVAAEEAMDGELLKEKGKENGDEVGDDGDGEFQKRLDEYFGNDGELDEHSLFLKDFFLKKKWVDKDKGRNTVEEELFGISEDEEEIEKQEDYEKGYNYRFEENAGDRVLGHARFVEGSVRKKTNARKVQRKSKEERMTIAELERKEELKHLKNLKKKEYMEKLNKVREIAGIGESGVCPFDEDDLEKDFDAEEYDRKMKEVFDESYYGMEDADPEFCSDRDEDGGGVEKPDFDKEDELLGLPKGWDASAFGEGFLAARERVRKPKVDTEGDHDNLEEEEEEEIVPEEPEEGKRKRKRKLSLWEKVASDDELDGHNKKELKEELYKLDYEDTIGDLKTRFKYQKVGPKRFGLSTEEILMMDDKELNQYVSLKKIAPYREKEWKVPSIQRYQQKMRNKLLLQGEKLDGQKTGKKKSSRDDGHRSISIKGVSEDGKEQLVESNDDMGNISRKSKRRRRQAELKLSHSRLMAYGKVPAKPKKKAKH
ncbi:hypothetical protein L1049_019576 [Liquidambar formosana]|uniref:Kri1-like C-terminal domain-containing protein n=1 Tax=Liquidambar formosana TaxID=63359 RepID=A0AAP0S6V0_LIQFO